MGALIKTTNYCSQLPTGNPALLILISQRTFLKRVLFKRMKAKKHEEKFIDLQGKFFTKETFSSCMLLK
jgi:hypothetical protein